MRVLVTGSNGYIGSVLAPWLQARGYDVADWDTDWFADCLFGMPAVARLHVRYDVREVKAEDLEGFDAVVHLAALSNDPVGNLDPTLTYEINHAATVRLAQFAKQAGVRRFVFSSSCSTYGAAGDRPVDEESTPDPVTPYGRTKVLAEHDLLNLADDRFSPIVLRNATAYGVSPRLRLDLVVNDFVASAIATGVIAIKSDGTPWRPLVHVEDICRAMIAVLEAPREAVHAQAFNVGQSEENYRVREVAEIVRQVVSGSRIEYAAGGGPDKRCYRVDCSKIRRLVPEFRPQWTVRAGAEQLAEAFHREKLSAAEIEGSRYFRLRRLREHLQHGRLGTDLRWIQESVRQAKTQPISAAEVCL